jgi:hypothetical protein
MEREPGPQTEQLVVTGIQPGNSQGYQSLLVGLDNTGTVMLKPFGSLQVTNAQGKTVQKFSLSLGAFLPQTSIHYVVYIKGQALSAGTYQAALTLTYGQNHILQYIGSFTITQQQLQKTFGPLPGLKAPSSIFDASSIPLWEIILIAVLGVLVIGSASGLFFWRLALRSVERGSRKRSNR